MLYYHYAYGMYICSEIKFSELVSFEFIPEKIDLKISIGKPPNRNTIQGKRKPFNSYNSNEYWQIFPNVAIFYVVNGKEVIIEPLSKNENEIRLFFIANIFYPILFQRNQIPLLASGILNKNNEAILFLGPILSGKSSLLMTFMQKGYMPFTDDCCIFNFSENNLMGIPSYPLIMNWSNTLKFLDIKNRQNYISLRNGIGKKSINIKEIFTLNPTKIKSIVILNESRKIDNIEIKKLSPSDAFLALHDCHPRPNWIEEMSKFTINFRLLSNISKSTPVYKMDRPFQKNTFFELVETLEKNIKI